MKKLLGVFAAWLSLLAPAVAQTATTYQLTDSALAIHQAAGFTCLTSQLCLAHVPIDFNGNPFGVTGNPFFVSPATGATFPVSGSVGLTGTLPAFATTPTFNCGTGCSGLGGGAVTIAASAVAAGAFVSGAALDGWDATQGAKADAICATATGTCSVVSLLKFLNTAAGAAIPAGTNIIGKVGIDQTTPGTTNLVALAANQSVNLAQVAGVATPVGSGVQATAQRMTLATDSPGIVALGQTTKSASVPVTTASDQLDPCQQGVNVRTPISISTAANIKIVTGTASKKTHVCGMMLLSAGTTNVGIVEGSGTNCATSTLGLIGGATAATGPNLTAQVGFVSPPAGYAIASTTVNANDICLINSAAIQVSGYIVTATP